MKEAPFVMYEATPVQRSKHNSAHKPIVVACDIYPELYGAQRSLLTLYSRWQSGGRYRLHYLYFVDGGLSEAMREIGVSCTRLELGPLLGSFNKRLMRLRLPDYLRLAIEMTTFSFRLAKLLRNLRADVLHCNTDRVGMMCIIGAHSARCPLITHMRRDRSFGWFDRLVYEGSNELAWVSRRVRDDFARVNGIVSPKGKVIYNGRVLPDCDAADTRAEVRSELGLGSDAQIALTVACFDMAKDHETLVRAAHTACRSNPRLVFLLAGQDFSADQERINAIKAQVNAAGLTNRVLFLGHRDDVGHLMRGADLLVNPSRHEALGGSLIEAIGHGLPCVATDTGGTAEIVPNGVCGQLVPKENATVLAQSILELLADDDRRRQYSVNARAHFAENFTAERCAVETGRFFDRVIEKYRRRADNAPS